MAENEIKQIVTIEASLSKIQSDLRTLEGSFKTSFGRIQGIATSTLGGLGIGLSVGGLVAFGKSLADLGDQLGDLSDRTGVSVEMLGGIRTVAETSGSSLEAFAKGVTIAQRNLGDITGSGKEAAQALAAMGLNVKELANVSPDEFIERLVSGLKKIENQNDRSAIAFKVLGKAGVELVPTLLKLADDGIKKLSTEATAGFKALGDLKDRMIETAAEAANFWAALVGRNVQTDRQSFLAQLSTEQAGIEALLNSLRSRLPESAQRDNATLKNLEFRLEGIRRLREKVQAAEDAPGGKPPPSRNLLGDDASQKAAQNFLAGIEKQLEQVQGKLKEGLFGEGSAIGDQLDAELKRFKEQLAIDKLPMPKGIEAAFQSFKAKIIESNDALRVQKLLLDQTFGVLDKLDAEEGKARDELIDKERKLNLETAERVRLLLLEQQTGAADVLDTERGKERDDAVQKTRDFGLSLHDLDAEQFKANQLSIALGSSFDLTSRSLEIQRQRVEALTAEYGALSPQVQQAVADYQVLQNQLAGRDLFNRLADSVDSGLSNTLRGIEEGSQTLGDGMRNLARNMVLSFQEEITKLGIINPIKNFLENMIFGANAGPARQTLSGIFGGAVGGQGGAATSTVTLTTAATQQLAAATDLQTAAAALTAAAVKLAGGSVPDIGSTFAGSLDGMLQDLPSPVTNVPDMFIENANLIDEGMRDINDSLSQGIQALSEIGTGGFSEFFSTLGTGLSEGLGSLGEALGSLGSSAGGWFSSLFSGIGALFAEEGGFVPSFASGGIVPANLHAGEYVMRAPSVKKFGLGKMNHINQTGEMPGGGGAERLHVTFDFKNAQIIPRAPWVEAKDVVNINIKSLRDQSELYNGIRDYGPKR
jgi:hypothetical protein